MKNKPMNLKDLAKRIKNDRKRIAYNEAYVEKIKQEEKKDGKSRV